MSYRIDLTTTTMCDTLTSEGYEKGRGGERMNGICEGCGEIAIIRQDEWNNWNCEQCDPTLFGVQPEIEMRNGKTYLKNLF